MKPTKEMIDQLADKLTWEYVYDWIMGDSWYGFPDPDSESDMQEAYDRQYLVGRDTAERYLNIAFGVKDDQ